MATVTFDKATRLYPGSTKPAVDAIDLHVADGEFLVLVGPSGCGKSTTLRMLYTAYQADGGSAEIDGLDVSTQKIEVRSRIGVLTHNAGIYERLSARENVRYFGQLHGMRGRTLDERIDQLAELLEMEDFMGTHIYLVYGDVPLGLVTF